MQTFLKGRRVGYWLSEKKMKKLNFQAFADLCRYVFGFLDTNFFFPSFLDMRSHSRPAIINYLCLSELGGVLALHFLLMTLTKGAITHHPSPLTLNSSFLELNFLFHTYTQRLRDSPAHDC